MIYSTHLPGGVTIGDGVGDVWIVELVGYTVCVVDGWIVVSI